MNSLDDCVEAAFAELDPRIRSQFADDPFTALDALGLKAREADHLTEKRADGGTCDGVSFLKEGVILYAATASRRENFTLGHELGHWLVDQAPDIYDWLAGQPEPAVALETLCDRLASGLVVPDDVINQIVGEGPVEANHVTLLYQSTNASIPVCAIALAGRLGTLGAVIVVRHAIQEVEYASVHPDPDRGWPVVHPWPGQPLPPSHPLRFLTAGQTARRKSFWETPWRSHAEFYLDAIAGQRRTVAVLADTDLWGVERFHAPQDREFDQRPELEVRCCGQVRRFRGYPHQDCGGGFCPICGKCRCDRRAAAEATCSRCGLQFLPHLLEKGLCDDCR